MDNMKKFRVGDKVSIGPGGGFDVFAVGKTGYISAIVAESRPQSLMIKLDASGGGQLVAGYSNSLTLISPPVSLSPGEYDVVVNAHGGLSWTPKKPTPAPVKTRLDYNRELLDLLRAEIEAYPDLRFGQVLSSFFLRSTDIDGYVKDPFYDESAFTLQWVKRRLEAQK